MGNINYIFVFLEGMLSFLSPCVLPLLPVYISYLAGNGKEVDENGNIKYIRKKVFLNTILFVLGISFAFFILGMSFSAIGAFFQENRQVFTTIAGVFIILMGLVQLGVVKFTFLEKEYKIKTKNNIKKMTPLLAFVFGFTFSFAWTPCIGPALASVLMLASSSESILQGNLLVLVYTIGFAIPFLLVGFFTTELLNFLRKHQKILKYTIKISAVILIIIGILTLTGTYERMAAYFNQISNNVEQTQEEQDTKENSNSVNDEQAENTQSQEVQNEEAQTNDNQENQQENNEQSDKQPAIDFTLKDQNGKEHHLADYKGKVVFLNFWTTWCTYCKSELQDLQELYNQYGKNEDDVVFLGVTSPLSDKNKNAADVSKDEILQYIEQNSLDFPMLFDEDGKVYNSYYIYAFPTSFLINQNGEVEWYSPGALPKEDIKSEIDRLLKK